MASKCIFCESQDSTDKIFYQTDLVFVKWDEYPVTKGHALIIPKRHCESYFDLTKEEIEEVNDAIKFMKNWIDKEYQPNGYNIGTNCGEASGQSIMHCHIHLIPRYNGDCKNPKGGVRGVIHEKQNY